MTISKRLRSDDGRTRVSEFVDDATGRVIGEEHIDLALQAEAAVVERHRDVLRQQLDPKRPDPSSKQVADAQAFIALAADVGVAEALAVADEVALAEPVLAEPVDVPVDPKPLRG